MYFVSVTVSLSFANYFLGGDSHPDPSLGRTEACQDAVGSRQRLRDDDA